jgi:proteasome lid subunit RPN8/RPN11
MKWTELEPDIKYTSLSDGFRCFDCYSILCFSYNFSIGINILIANSCHENIQAHVHSENKEIGGLLLGRVFQGKNKQGCANYMLTIVTRSIPTEKYDHTRTSLRMDTEVWSRADKYFSDGEIVVGWYHSHPNLGAFFSETDQKTQQAFFNHGYSMGLVIDPVRNTQEVFIGARSIRYDQNLLVVNDHILDKLSFDIQVPFISSTT